MAGLPATVTSASTRPLNSEPMIDSWTKSSPTLSLPLACELRHARRGAGAARRAVDRLVAVEDGVAGVRAGHRRLAGPQHVRQPADPGILRMDELVFFVEPRPHHRAPGDEIAGRMIGHVAEVLLRLDDGVEIAAIGDVDR